jgi:protein SCO1/2
VKRIRLILWVGVAAVLAFLGVLMLQKPSVQPTSKAVSGSTFGGPFILVGSDGKPFSIARLAGKPYAIYFGYTRCPDTCPTTLNRLVALRRQVGLGDDSFKIAFVTVDPARDGPKEVGTYEHAFGAPIIGLTGSQAQIDQVKKQYGIFSRTVPDGSGDYSVDHTATVLLFDRQGKFAGTIAPDEPDPTALEKLKALARG